METEPGKLFIGGISWDTSEERLKDYFQSFGEVVEAMIMKDRTTGRARGFGFVVFADAFVAERVVRERHVIAGRTVEAKKAVPREDHQSFNRSNSSTQGSPGPACSTKKIFVGGLPSSITEIEFKRYFDQFGTITDVVVMHDHNTQRPRGFGFITYDAEESVDRVLYKNFHELNGKMVEVKRAVPKESSPGPTRNQTMSHSYGINRVNGFINGFGHNSLSPVHRNSHGPATVDRNGYYPYGMNNRGMGLNLDSGLGLNQGSSVESGLGYGNGIKSYFSVSPSRFTSPFLGNLNNGGGVSLSDATNRNNMRGNASPNYDPNSIYSNAFNLGNVRDIWGRALVSAKSGGSDNSSESYSYCGRHDKNDFSVIRPIQAPNNGRNIIGPSFRFMNNVGGGNIHGNDSFYSDHLPWKSLPDELDGSALFGYERAEISANIASNTRANGFIGDYSVTAR